MGSDYCSVQEACDLLGVTDRTLRNYVKKGALSRQGTPAVPLFRRIEVEQLRACQGSSGPAFNRTTLLLLEDRVSRLERDMAVARRMLDIRTEPLRPSPEDAKILLAAVERTQREGRWGEEEMAAWAEVFQGVDETALDLVCAASGEPEAWRPLVGLCLDMLRQVGTDAVTSSSLRMQVLHMALDLGRRQLRGAVLLRAAAGKDASARESLLDAEGGVAGLLSRLRSKNQ